MIMSLGGTPEPLIKSIAAFCPDKIIFFASHDSVPLSQTILCGAGKKPAAEFVITDNPNSLVECYSKARECIDRAQKTGISAHDIMVDYTGGTKVMTAALLLASLGRSFRFNYVGGTMRNKNGLGIVVDGHEQLFSESSPWALFAEEERRQIVTLFNCRRFSAVIEMITSLDRKLPPNIQHYFDFVLSLAQGFLLWDQFNHKSAQRYLEKGITALEKYLNIYPGSELEGFLSGVKTCKTHLDNLLSSTHDLQKFDRTLILDLLNNARRKMQDKRFDDAAARIYRALELYGQILFKQVAHCDNSKVKPSVIPEKIRAEFERKYFDSYTKDLKLPLKATFECLREMGHEAGERFFKNKKEIENIQSNRNYSILAHGINPVTEKAAQSIFAKVSEFVQETEFFDFPQLP
jgi:CRISPR-associated protein (TIGR02710 family)